MPINRKGELRELKEKLDVQRRDFGVKKLEEN